MPAASAVLVYFVATGVEIAVIEALRPTEIELTWISDAVLALAFGSAMFLWLHLSGRALIWEQESGRGAAATTTAW
jgi:hypothetical protein